MATDRTGRDTRGESTCNTNEIAETEKGEVEDGNVVAIATMALRRIVLEGRGAQAGLRGAGAITVMLQICQRREDYAPATVASGADAEVQPRAKLTLPQPILRSHR
eukprot:4715461-Lingulodinium_polyedra.AAC.1